MTRNFASGSAAHCRKRNANRMALIWRKIESEDSPMQNIAPGSTTWFAAEAVERNAAARNALKGAWYGTLATVFWLAVMAHLDGWVGYFAFGLAAICAYRVIRRLRLAWNERSAALIAAGLAGPMDERCPTCHMASAKPWMPFTRRVQDTIRE